MKHKIWSAFGALAIASLIFGGCAAPEDEDIRTLEDVAVEDSPFSELDIAVGEPSDGTITAGEDSDFDISDHRAKLTTKPAPSPEPEPEPSVDEPANSATPEQQADNGTSPNNESSGSSGQNGSSASNNSSNGGSSSNSGSSNSGGSSNGGASRGTNGVYNLSSARNYLAGHCPGVRLESVQGSTSYYDPNRGVIMLGTNMRGGEGRLYFVLMHELMHHYQWNYYSPDQWNSKLADGSLELEADHMTFHVAPGTIGQGFYTNSPASGSQLSQVQQIVSQGRAAGC